MEAAREATLDLCFDIAMATGIVWIAQHLPFLKLKPWVVERMEARRVPLCPQCDGVGEIARSMDGKDIGSTRVCPDCEGTGIVFMNAGCCGGCEHCGGREETQVPCHCTKRQ